MKWRLFCLGAMIGGFRRGELIALEWHDVDFLNMCIHVNNSISMTVNGQAIVNKPKTESSVATVDMPEWYMLELKEYHERWMDEKEKAGTKWEEEKNQYVFHSGFGKPLYHTTPSKWWKNFCERHELKYIRFHDLRHSTATLLIESGASMKAIQERLRHSKYQTTADIYTHVTKKLSRETADKFNKFNPKK